MAMGLLPADPTNGVTFAVVFIVQQGAKTLLTVFYAWAVMK